MKNMTLEDMQKELVVLHKKTFKLDGDPRAGATAEAIARCAELEQQIEVEIAYMKGGDDTEKKDTPPTADTRTDAQKIADLTEELRRANVIVDAYKAPKGVAIAKRFRPDGETIRIDEAMLPSLAEAERLPVSIPEALKEGLIDEAKALLLNKAVERRFRCYVKKAGFHENDRTHMITEWKGGLRRDLSAENIAKADAWAKKLGRVDTDGKPIYEWDTTLVIPNMDNI